MSESERIALIGWGAIGRRVAGLLSRRKCPVEIAAIAVRDRAVIRPDLPQGALLIDDPKDIAATGVTLVVEMAGRSSVFPYGMAALSHGMDFAVSSTSAFVDADCLLQLQRLAAEKRCKLIIPPGALGGIDALGAAARLPVDRVEHRITKPAKAWQGTPAAQLIDLEEISEPTVIFSDSARAAADAFPQNANVAVITALAGIGLDRTRVTLVADPDADSNLHEIFAEGAFGNMQLRFENAPLSTNPKSSEMTALSLVRMIESRVAALVV
ncbi:aspartate dehydrogenase [Brucella pituitosa]|uniref:aspartate dehydrogenase n=1 Tax=Brucella pituitosa TaxID=571256 RepID=UPI0009A24FA0|nr:aspartate dehydrogenase [Brucella pituitosa]